MRDAGHNFTGSAGQLLQLALGIRAEVQESDQEATYEEEGVNAVLAVGDRLEEEQTLHSAFIFQVLAVFECNNTQMAEDYPTHRDASKTVDTRDCIAAHLLIEDRLKVLDNRERNKDFSNKA